MKYLITSLVVLIVVGLLLIEPIIAYATKSSVSFAVNDKAVVVSGNGSSTHSKYLIYTTDGVFEDTDSLWYWKWNSSDMYNKLERGKFYTATVYGFRIPFFSTYKNIVTVEAVPNE